MAKVDFKKAKNITKAGAPVERDVKWSVEVTSENLEQLKSVTDNSNLSVGDLVELEGQVFVKRMSFKASRDASKAFEWDIDYENVEKSKLKSVDSDQLQATQLLGTICEDAKGTPFFTSAQDVYDSDPSFIAALYQLADEVNNFMGKLVKKTSNETNSSVNLSSTESVAAPSKKQSKK
ncbi:MULTISPECIES: phage tail assembly chaperone family protein, TAC [unclassified Acinetobacter]|uniref:phage tail assembly chaperone family protein, TAC n=1 Tax=unclassified Acinetobacter TaxID=196816 RepID=UPI00124EA765|nr:MULTISPECIES: phage tail assembly chaperone family protein, TAC [unclassified Acinetobacter]